MTSVVGTVIAGTGGGDSSVDPPVAGLGVVDSPGPSVGGRSVEPPGDGFAGVVVTGLVVTGLVGSGPVVTGPVGSGLVGPGAIGRGVEGDVALISGDVRGDAGHGMSGRSGAGCSDGVTDGRVVTAG